ncbi:cytochrome P450 [Streptomyces sp. NBC_01187]|uniref:cytochrome P450 family protein n=1 Tax=Streptomyces sp. NBC_01187 TaxID=2903766 RepID=UPI003867061F|nr:cytochrome P450 [Streptomyces sp. NBC_01187]
MSARDFDLPAPFDSDFFADPYSTYADLREAAPVHRVALPDGTPIWLVLREADVRSWLSDPRLTVDKKHSGSGYKGFSLPPALDANLMNLDGDSHQRLRRLVSKAFTPRRTGSLRESVVRAAEHLAENVSRAEACDLVNDFAIPLPLIVIGDMLDVPEKDRRPFADWVSTMLAPEHPAEIAESISAIHAFLIDLVAARRRSPGDDLLSALIDARDNEDKLTEDELVSLAFLLLMAGSENVQHIVSNGIHTLLQHPDQLDEIRDRTTLIPQAVEELLRLVHPNQMAIRRFPTVAIQIAGTEVPAGDTVMLCLASANRDPARYPEPDRFDLHRVDKTHLALGHGFHFCLGASLARMEAEVAINTLLSRFPKMRHAVPVSQLDWRASFRSHALKALPVELS